MRQRPRVHDQAAIRKSGRTPRPSRSISARSRTLTRLKLHPRDGATACNAANWAIAAAMPGSRSTATRVTPGAISLSNSSHFAADAEFELDEPGGVAARPRQALDEASADRIGNDREHDRYGTGYLQQGDDAAALPVARMTSGARPNQFGRILADALGVTFCPATVDPHVAPIDPAQLLQALQETPRSRACPSGSFCGQIREHADAPHALTGLRPRRERPRCRARRAA